MQLIRCGARTVPSKSPEDARKRIVQLYREWMRGIPEITDRFTLDIPIVLFRKRIRLEFEKYRNITDLKLVDVLLFKDTVDYIETHNIWKQKLHVMNYFDEHSSLLRLKEENKSFLQKFLGSK